MQNIVILSKTEHLPGVKPKTEVELIIGFDSEKQALDWAEEITEAVEWSSCIVTTLSEPFDIFWQKYRHMKRVKQILNEPCGQTQDEASKDWHFSHPYVCVIHEPTKRGYYLDRNYQWICNVEHIIRPGAANNEDYVPETLKRIVEHETEFNHQAASFTTPKWADELPPSEFTTYWLY
jgi:hypothetical protein